MITISKNIALRDEEISFKAIRASGPGGQHVNTTSSAVQLRFDAAACAAISPSMLKRLAAIAGRRLSADGVLTLRVDTHSSQHRNREIAINRLVELLKQAEKPRKFRVKTRPTRGSVERRLSSKAHKGQRKQSRSKVSYND